MRIKISRRASMAQKKPAKKSAPTSAKAAAVTRKKVTGFTDEEKGAMRQRVKELQAATTKAEEEKAVIAAIAAMKGSDRTMAEQIHAVIKASAPVLAPKLWYGMPA